MEIEFPSKKWHYYKRSKNYFDTNLKTCEKKKFKYFLWKVLIIEWNIPHLSKNTFGFYRKQHDDNISKTNEFYTKFRKEDELDEKNIFSVEEKNEAIKLYQNIDWKEKLKKLK